MQTREEFESLPPADDEVKSPGHISALASNSTPLQPLAAAAMGMSSSVLSLAMTTQLPAASILQAKKSVQTASRQVSPKGGVIMVDGNEEEVKADEHGEFLEYNEGDSLLNPGESGTTGSKGGKSTRFPFMGFKSSSSLASSSSSSQGLRSRSGERLDRTAGSSGSSGGVGGIGGPSETDALGEDDSDV